MWVLRNDFLKHLFIQQAYFECLLCIVDQVLGYSNEQAVVLSLQNSPARVFMVDTLEMKVKLMCTEFTVKHSIHKNKISYPVVVYHLITVYKSVYMCVYFFNVCPYY